jgi:hypothetical protein
VTLLCFFWLVGRLVGWLIGWLHRRLAPSVCCLATTWVHEPLRNADQDWPGASEPEDIVSEHET